MLPIACWVTGMDADGPSESRPGGTSSDKAMISLVLLTGAEVSSTVPVSVPPEQAVTKKRLKYIQI